MLLLDRAADASFFAFSKIDGVLLWQHVFWAYSHPAVYIMVLPAMGMTSLLISKFSRNPIFGYSSMVISMIAIAVLGFLVWGHHMFVSGQSYTADVVFSLLTFLVAIPSAIKVFNWVSTLYKGSIEVGTPMLYALAFIFLFSIGGLTGLMQGALAVNVHIHDTAFIVAHFHYVMFGGTGFAFFAAIHFWFPKMFGKMYNQRIAKIAWGFLFVGLQDK